MNQYNDLIKTSKEVMYQAAEAYLQFIILVFTKGKPVKVILNESLPYESVYYGYVEEVVIIHSCGFPLISICFRYNGEFREFGLNKDNKIELVDFQIFCCSYEDYLIKLKSFGSHYVHPIMAKAHAEGMYTLTFSEYKQKANEYNALQEQLDCLAKIGVTPEPELVSKNLKLSKRLLV